MLLVYFTPFSGKINGNQIKEKKYGIFLQNMLY